VNVDYQVLVIEDEKLAGEVIRDRLEEEGYLTRLCTTAQSALDYFHAHSIDLVLLDYRLPDADGHQVLAELKATNPMVPVIVMTAYSSVEKAVSMLKAGAHTYLTKPLEMESLMHEVRRALEHITLKRENLRLAETLQERYTHPDYVFQSAAMQQTLNTALRGAASQANVLITGESGTGKEVMAFIMHHHSLRRNGPMVRVNLSALPETLVEAELFGSVRGAFTGAVTRRGRFEEASGGTLFLDEIGEMPLPIQVKLLRVIQDKEITRLGSNENIPVDIRLITATNRDLEKEVSEKRFRADLFFRLNVLHIDLPPLRQRKEEIPSLVDLFIRKFNIRENKSINGVSREAMDRLMKYDFPGNIRELENIIERAVVLGRGKTLVSVDLPLFLTPENEKAAAEEKQGSLAERIKTLETRVIRDTLQKHGGNQSRAAEELGISESGLRYKLNQLKISLTSTKS